jgi:hypothetical protein
VVAGAWLVGGALPAGAPGAVVEFEPPPQAASSARLPTAAPTSALILSLTVSSPSCGVAGR